MAIVFAAFFGCSGKVIHLGDGKGQGGSGARDAAIDGTAAMGASGDADAGGARDAAIDGTAGSGASGLADAGGARDAAIDGTAGSGASGLADGGGGCTPSNVKPSEILWIGDAWVSTPSTQYTRVWQLARDAGASGYDEREPYVVAPVLNPTWSQQTLGAIVEQYNSKTHDAGATKFKVLIMDGGTLDPWLASNADASINDAIDKVVSTFKQLLATVKGDGTIEHVIYFLCPETPGFPGIATLRPLLRETCEKGPVDCHFLDLQPLWAGHPEYYNGIVPSTAGGQVIAEQIWSIMQKNCIAQ
jgi:hypothetical protein